MGIKDETYTTDIPEEIGTLSAEVIINGEENLDAESTKLKFKKCEKEIDFPWVTGEDFNRNNLDKLLCIENREEVFV